MINSAAEGLPKAIDKKHKYKQGGKDILPACSHNSSEVEKKNLAYKSLAPARGFLSRLENFFLSLGVVCILLLGIEITLSIILRTFFDTGIPDEVVLVGDMMIGALILPLASVAASRSFIQVDILTLSLGQRWQNFLNVLTAIVGIVAVAPITYAGYLSMTDAIETGSYFFGIMKWPKWPGYTLFFMGYCLFFVRLIDIAVYDLLVAMGVVRQKTVSHMAEGAN